MRGFVSQRLIESSELTTTAAETEKTSNENQLEIAVDDDERNILFSNIPSRWYQDSECL